jgi:cysteinyl-tRNA synthetase
MSLDLLGDGFDLHGGGQDLAFPHHENERAQAVATGHAFARHWVHNGFIEIDGEKMSKSLGNFTNLLDLLESTDPRAFRLLVLRSHYRAPIEVSRASTDDASKALQRLDEFVAEGRRARTGRARCRGARRVPPADGRRPQHAGRLRPDVHARAPGQPGLRRRRRRDGGQPRRDRPRDRRSVGLELAVAKAPSHARRRAQALAANATTPAAKEWDRADAMRAQLEAMGYIVEDTPKGTQIRRA